MSRIITKSMILQAIHLVRPSAIQILLTEEAVWGPRAVWGFVEAPGVDQRVSFDFHAEGDDEEWNSAWGDSMKFVIIAGKKLDVVMREQKDTSVIVNLAPWLLKEEEFMYAGGAYSDGIGAAVSGARGYADECISRTIVNTIKMLALLEAERRVQSGQKEITSGI